MSGWSGGGRGGGALEQWGRSIVALGKGVVCAIDGFVCTPIAPATLSRSATRWPQKMAPASSGTCDSTCSADASTSISLFAVDHSRFTASSTAVSSRSAYVACWLAICGVRAVLRGK